jgi:hypothetical protein
MMSAEQIILSVVGTLVSIIGFFSIRTLKQIDENQSRLSEKLDSGLGEAFERLRDVEIAQARLEAEHRLNHGFK